MFEMAIDFANLCEKDFTADKLKYLFTKHKMSLSLKSIIYRKEGETDFITQNTKYFTLDKHFPDNENLDFLYRKNPNFTFFYPEQEDFNSNLWEALKYIRNDVRNWIDYLIDNQNIEFERLDKFLKKNEIKLTAHKLYDDPLFPYVSMTFIQNNLEDHIYSYEVVKNMYENKFEEFKRLRKCLFCKKYFYAQDIRKVLCSDSCRNKYFYRMKKNKSLN